MQTRRPVPADRPALASLLERIENFTPDERSVALELIDLALAHPETRHPDYWVQVAEDAGRLLGYICYGPTPMTEGTFDLYWIASAPEARGRGVGRRLVAAMEEDLRSLGGRLVRVETSSQEAYGGTRDFYAAIAYGEEARFRDFYKPGDDLIILKKQL